MSDKTIFFYHGGVTEDFDINKLDIYRLSEKQQKKGRNYAGFYMFDESNRDKAFHYAEQTNWLNNTDNCGVIKIEIDSNINVFAFNGEIGQIDRISLDELKNYANQGYDMITGKSFDGEQYILLNKDKIVSIEFQDMSMRYPEEKGRIK